MSKKEPPRVTSGHGSCCPHCADSKYPCVNMEKVMKTPKAGDSKDPAEEK